MDEHRTPATTTSRARTIPGPAGLEKWRLVPRLVSRPHECLASLARQYGGLVLIAFPTEQSVLVSNAEYLEHVFHANNRNYDKQTPRWATLRQLWGDGLLTADGDHWRRQRQRIQPAFHQACLQNFAAIAVEESQRMARAWAASAAAGAPRDVYPDMLQVAVRTVTRAMFGADLDAQTDLVIRAVGDTHDYINPVSLANMFHLPIAVRRLTVPGFRRFHDALRTIHHVFDEIIRRRAAAATPRADLLGMMMAAADEETSQVMSLDELHDEMITMLMAGHETTGIATAWSWYWLSQRPDVQRELQAEVDRVLGGRPATFEDLPQLHYTKMVFQEAMRLNPPIWGIERRAREEDLIDGYRIPRGATVITSPYVMHRHPDYWDEPEEFKPLRFLPEEEKKRPQYAYFPFGGGPRRCVGFRVGLLEGQLMLATFAQSFTVRLTPGHPVEPNPRVNMPPRYGLPMILEPRTAAAAVPAAT